MINNPYLCLTSTNLPSRQLDPVGGGQRSNMSDSSRFPQTTKTQTWCHFLLPQNVPIRQGGRFWRERSHKEEEEETEEETEEDEEEEEELDEEEETEEEEEETDEEEEEEEKERSGSVWERKHSDLLMRRFDWWCFTDLISSYKPLLTLHINKC